MSEQSDTVETIRKVMETTLADYWTDFEDDHPDGYAVETIVRFIAELEQQGYEILKVADTGSISVHGLALDWRNDVWPNDEVMDAFLLVNMRGPDARGNQRHHAEFPLLSDLFRHSTMWRLSLRREGEAE